MKEILRELREKNNLSQATVAEYLGVSRQMYMKYESGENEPSVKMVVLLSKLYKVSYEQIIDNKTDDKIEKLASSLDVLYMHKFNCLNSEQKTIVGNLIESLAAMNKSFKTPEKKNYREPGGLTGDFYMAEDFDKTPDFKEEK